MSHVYVRALALGCFYRDLSEGGCRRDRVAGQLRGDQECPFRGSKNLAEFGGRVPESDARSVRALFISTSVNTGRIHTG